jgi:fatty-acid desaturase
MTGEKEKKHINWLTTGFMLAFHIGAIAALFMFSWKALIVAVIVYWVAGSLGIGMGYHRLLTHRGHTSRSPSAHRQAGRSALPARRRLLGAHGLDSHRADFP